MKSKLFKIVLPCVSLFLLSMLFMSLLTARPAKAGWPGATFRLTVDVSPSVGGIIKVNTDSPASYPANLAFDNGAIVHLEASALNGYRFTNWSGDLSGNVNPANIVVDCNKKIIANFARVEPNWWLIGGSTIGIIIIGVIIALVVKSRTLRSRMSKSISKIDILQSKRLTFILRILLGGVLLVFGASKLPDLAGFADTVISYKVLPESLAIPFGYALPWAEVVVGLLLILGLGLRFVAPVAILIIASFIAGTAGTLYLFGTKGPWGCLPGLNWMLGWSHIVIQVVMLIMAAQIWLHKGEFWSLDKRLLGREWG